MQFKTIGAVLLALFTVAGWGYEPAGTPPDWGAPMGKPMKFSKLLIDRLEAGFADEEDTYAWDVQGWYGTDRSRLWLKTEGEGEQGEAAEAAELQVLYSQMLAPFWDWQLGVRHDFEPGPERTHLTLGVQGVAPFEFEWDSALFVNQKGKVSARLEVEYDLNVTQRWVVQSRFEWEVGFSADRDLDLGSGSRSTELGVRLRYHLRREVAPYIGVSWLQRYGDTKQRARDLKTFTSMTSLVVGIRIWW